MEKSTSVGVKLNVLEVLVVFVRLAGELSVTEGATVSTVNVLVAEVSELLAPSQQVTDHVWLASVNVEVELLV